MKDKGLKIKDKGCTLFIDTTDFNKITYALAMNGKVRKKSYKIDPHGSHETLAMLEKFLKAMKIKPTSPLTPPLMRGGEQNVIRKIVACKGPGSYTGTRIGVTHALALGFAWNVPVKFLDKEKFEKTLSRR